MQSLYNVVTQLTSPTLSDIDRPRMLNDFASNLGWRPSDRLFIPAVSDFANAHLLVEHGLENSAVITFLRSPRRFADLGYGERSRLLNISYNNLVDWHVQVQLDEVAYVFNRTDPPQVVEKLAFSRDNIDALGSEAFERVVGKRLTPNFPALDDALIRTISLWKRNLSAEIIGQNKVGSLSALFNAVIFTRAVEDHHQNYRNGQLESDLLLEIWREFDGNIIVRDLIKRGLQKLDLVDIPDYVLNENLLGIFDAVDSQTIYAFLSDFYRNKYAPLYDYDFSIISKHALSRIYEHYVSILQIEESEELQLRFIPPLPSEQRDKAAGSIYTPQFIARFFARYLREQMPPLSFRRLRSIDPACGSGIFLRTLLELQCDPSNEVVTTEFINSVFDSTYGLDITEDACQATRLSLSLLHLVLTNELPGRLNINSVEAIQYYEDHPELQNAFDVVVANPPFVSLDSQNAEVRERISTFMEGYARGRVDTYLAFLRLGLEMLKPGGYGLFVLPHSFLLGENALEMRRLISESSWIRCLADLSAIRVFDDVGVYVILLVFQKKIDIAQVAPNAIIVRCQDLVGRALQFAVEGHQIESSFFSVYNVEQSIFRQDDWIILPPTETSIRRKLKSFRQIDDFMFVRTGFISGLDDVFIIPNGKIPDGEHAIFVPYLHDRDMKAYSVPDMTDKYFFYPYIDNVKIDEQTLQTQFPQTWEYLNSHRRRLEARGGLKRYKRDWWEPMWSRPPENMIRPKIISPHLVLSPRFSVDRDGKFAVSHSPLLYPRQPVIEDDLLRYFVAVLNSTPCYWFIATHSHTYQRGYVMLEPKTLRKTPVPDPAKVPPVIMLRLLDLVDQRLASTGIMIRDIEKQIDDIVADLYNLSREERIALGMED